MECLARNVADPEVPSSIGKTHVFMQRPVVVGHDEITGFEEASHPNFRRLHPPADHHVRDGSRIVDIGRSRGLVQRTDMCFNPPGLL